MITIVFVLTNFARKQIKQHKEIDISRRYGKNNK
jgi:hypothetical protein